MNKEKLHRTSVSYIENFLDDVRHIKNRVLVKTVIARMAYGSVIKIKIYWNLRLGHWERYSKNILRVKSQMDLTVLHSTLIIMQQYFSTCMIMTKLTRIIKLNLPV